MKIFKPNKYFKKLIHELARDYKNIGINLGKYVKADIVGCAKELENK